MPLISGGPPLSDVLVASGVGVSLDPGAGVSVSLGVDVSVAPGVGVSVSPGVGVSVGVSVSVAPGVLVSVIVAVSVLVTVAVTVSVVTGGSNAVVACCAANAPAVASPTRTSPAPVAMIFCRIQPPLFHIVMTLHPISARATIPAVTE